MTGSFFKTTSRTVPLLLAAMLAPAPASAQYYDRDLPCNAACRAWMRSDEPRRSRQVEVYEYYEVVPQYYEERRAFRGRPEFQFDERRLPPRERQRTQAEDAQAKARARAAQRAEQRKTVARQTAEKQAAARAQPSLPLIAPEPIPRPKDLEPVQESAAMEPREADRAANASAGQNIETLSESAPAPAPEVTADAAPASPPVRAEEPAKPDASGLAQADPPVAPASPPQPAETATAEASPPASLPEAAPPAAAQSAEAPPAVAVEPPPAVTAEAPDRSRGASESPQQQETAAAPAPTPSSPAEQPASDTLAGGAATESDAASGNPPADPRRQAGLNEMSDEDRAVLKALQASAPDLALSIETPRIGETLPENVPLTALPSQIVEKLPSFRGFQFVISNGDAYLVSPASRRVLRVWYTAEPRRG